jgi:ABC-type Fe3+/spermidine/putrescine transport system ATPase subunit
MPLLEVQDISKSYPDGWTLSDVAFTVERGENACLLGPSGCGKTTLLRLIAGLETPDSGRILANGQDVTGVPPHLRGFGLMFQEYVLFPHKTVYGNVAFGLQMQGAGHHLAGRVAKVLELVGLTGFEGRDVNQLSGGERQRVALARSLAPRPTLLMLDEPLGALDRSMRERLMEELPRILRQASTTAITVTHDQEEAFAIADRIVLMRSGQVVQVGAPEEVYWQPASGWAARFLGLTNVLRARVLRRGLAETPIGPLQVQGTKDQCTGTGSVPRDAGDEMQVLIRPEAARIDVAGPNPLEGTVVGRSFRGEYYRLSISHATGIELTFNFQAGATLPALGEAVELSLDPRALVLLSPG